MIFPRSYLQLCNPAAPCTLSRGAAVVGSSWPAGSPSGTHPVGSFCQTPGQTDSEEKITLCYLTVGTNVCIQYCTVIANYELSPDRDYKNRVR